MASGLLKTKVPSARQGMKAVFLIIHLPEVSLSIMKLLRQAIYSSEAHY